MLNESVEVDKWNQEVLNYLTIVAIPLAPLSFPESEYIFLNMFSSQSNIDIPKTEIFLLFVEVRLRFTMTAGGLCIL